MVTIDDINTISDIIEHFEATGGITPAHGVSYIDVESDMCATIYRNKARVFYDRDSDIKNKTLKPAFFSNDKIVFGDDDA